MKTIIKILKFTFSLLLLLGATTRAQDSTRTFPFEVFRQMVLQHHPIIKQANTLTAQAQQELLIAKGGFDPKLEIAFDTKYFDEKTYFNFWDNLLKVPLSFGGIDLKAGFERNVGQVLGSDIRTPLDGISYLGVNVPLGQRLLFDERRATLKNAQLLQQINENERVKVLNKYVFAASKSYWDWYLAFQNQVLMRQFYDLAATRYQLTKKRMLQGDLAAMDTLDAQVTLIDRQTALAQAEVELQNSRLLLSNFLWNESENPLEVPTNWQPQAALLTTFSVQKIDQLLDQARRQHPDILKLTYKAQQLKIDEKLSKELLKPRVDVGITSLNYAHRLLTGVANNNSVQNNFKFSVDFSMPLFLRKERGKLALIRIKQMQNDLELTQYRREIANDIMTAYNDLTNLSVQLKNQQTAIEMQQQLVVLEEKRFAIGESTLFMLNQREAKWVEMLQKRESMRAKYQKSLATLLFAAGGWE